MSTKKTSGSWIRVSRRHPCPVCGHPDWCAVNQEGTLAFCPRVPSDWYVDGEAKGWLHRLNNQNASHSNYRLFPIPFFSSKGRTDDQQATEWEPIAWALHRSGRRKLRELASELGVARVALEVLRVGRGNLRGSWCWSFPERNGKGRVVGINRRLIPSGEKRTAPGSRRGLTFSDEWHLWSGPILIVEGGSDTAAGITLGRATVGRPSCTGGVRYLAELLAPFRRRRIIVVAEHDRKRHEELLEPLRSRHSPTCPGCMACWPGRAGAIDTAKALTRKLGRKVEWQFPPDGAKDLRAWLQSQPADPNDAEVAHNLGQTILGGDNGRDKRSPGS